MSINNKERNKMIEKCILSLATGNIEAMDLLYKTIKNDIYALGLSKVCNKFDADDILQDTFVRIYENAKLYVPMGKPLAWIFTIENNIINRYFQIKNKHEIINDDIVNNYADESFVEDKIITNNLLINLLNNLNDFEKEVISLHIVSGLKFREISKILDKPLSTVLSKYNRAIKKLQKIAKKEENEDEKETKERYL